MSSEAGSSTQCPVFFCGKSQVSVGFDTFLSNAQKSPGFATKHVANMAEAAEALKTLDHGLVILLLANKNDLVAVLNILPTLKKRIDKGVIRALVYSLIDMPKIPGILKSKGCAEMLADGLTQKALVHKLQRHIQLVQSKFKTVKQEKAEDTTKVVAKKAADKGDAAKAKLKFVPALQDINDCWLVKNKKDFKYIRGNWIGEMIGPGPSAGSWVEIGGTPAQPVFRWTPRTKSDNDPFVPGKGSWFYAGRKPEFDWKSNRWRFVGETPSLFFKATDAAQGTGSVFRFRSPVVGQLEIALNSAAAKGKLKAIIETFAEEKVIKEDKKKEKSGGEQTIEKEKKKKPGDEELEIEREKKGRGPDYEGDLGPDEDPKEWGELEEGEEEAAGWNDRSGEGEEEESPDWKGTDIGRGNKFNSGRGLGQGDGAGNKGYKYDEEEEGKKASGDGEEDPEFNDKVGEDGEAPPTNDRTGEGDDEEPHDWTGLDVGRGNKFTSGRGLGQGQGGDKGYKYDKDKGEGPSGESEENDDFDVDAGLEDGEGDGATAEAPEVGAAGADAQESMESEEQVNLQLDELLGKPSEDKEWATGVDAFDKITLEITLERVDVKDSKPLSDVSILERQEADLLLDAPSSGFSAGEKVQFTVLLGQKGKKKKLQLNGTLKTAEAQEGGRDIILVGVAELSRPHLNEIQSVFEERQQQLLHFLREAKGY